MKNPRCLSSMTLKRIALATMLVDHVTLFLFTLLPLYAAPSGVGVTVYEWGRHLGRVAFPIYCFLIAEGARHTKDRVNYALRLLLFALLSVIPYNLVNGDPWYYPGEQSVLFDLLLGLLVIYAYDYFRTKPKPIAVPATVFSVVAGCALAYLLRADYLCLGILLIFTFYALRDKPSLCFAVSLPVFAAGSFLLYFFYYFQHAAAPAFLSGLRYAWRCLPLELWGYAAFPLIFLYNGKKGKSLWPRFYYWFYPAHLIVIYLLALLIGKILH